MTIRFEAQSRQELGTSASRGLRRQGQVPVVVYGKGQETLHGSIEHHELLKHVNDVPFHKEPITLAWGDKTLTVRVRMLQRHKTKPKVQHVDFVYA